MTIDRLKRDELIRVIERYLAKEITSFQFDEQIFDVDSQTTDSTIHEIVMVLWLFYDDIKDHPVRLEKQEWDVYQRMILLLKSDVRWERTHRSQWSGTEPVAMLLLALFIWMALTWEFATAWGIAAIPMALAAWMIRIRRGRFESNATEEQLRMFPFTSFGELRRVRRSVAGFRKQRHPRDIARSKRHEHIGTWIGRTCEGILFPVYFFLIAPLVLLVEAFPMRLSKSTIRLPEDEQSGADSHA